MPPRLGHSFYMDDEFQIDEEAKANQKAQARGDDDLVDEEERADGKIKKLRDELATSRAESKNNLDGWQRAKADYVNALRRFEEEKTSAKESGVAKAIEAMLPAMDALERAKAHGDVPESFQGIVKQLESAFASLGLEPLGSIGEAFDPNLHEALGHEDGEEDSVTSVLETGWKRGDRVIRPAKVKVGKA